MDIKINGVAEFLKSIDNITSSIKKAQVSANNKTAAQAASFAKKTIREEYNIKAAQLNKDIKVKKSFGDSPAIISGTGKGLSLKYFGAKQKKAGVEVQVTKGNKKTIIGAFGPKIDRLGGNVFQREGKDRLPIKKLLGPGAAKMLGSKKIMPLVLNYISDNYKRIYEHEIEWFAKKK